MKIVIFAIPENVQSVEPIICSYTAADGAGTVIQLDKTEAGLQSAVKDF